MVSERYGMVKQGFVLICIIDVLRRPQSSLCPLQPACPIHEKHCDLCPRQFKDTTYLETRPLKPQH